MRVCLIHRKTSSAVIQGQIWNKRQEKVLVRCCNSGCYEMKLLCWHKVNHLTYKDNMAQVFRGSDLAAVLVIVFANPAGSEVPSALQHLGDSWVLLNVSGHILYLHAATEKPLWFRAPWACPSAPESTCRSCLCCNTAAVLVWRHSEGRRCTSLKTLITEHSRRLRLS